MSWRIPSDDDIKTLEMYLGMSEADADDTSWRGTDEGSAMAGGGTWNSGNLTTDSRFGETNLDFPAVGLRHAVGIYYNRSHTFRFWSSSESGDSAWTRYLHYTHNDVTRNDNSKAYGFSVRCVKDATTDEQNNINDYTVSTDAYEGNDGTLYDTVKIGTQIWLAENLRETKFANGDTIPLITDGSTSDTEPHRYIYDDNASVEPVYGYLYNWSVVDDSRGVAGGDTPATNSTNFFNFF